MSIFHGVCSRRDANFREHSQVSSVNNDFTVNARTISLIRFSTRIGSVNFIPIINQFCQFCLGHRVIKNCYTFRVVRQRRPFLLQPNLQNLLMEICHKIVQVKVKRINYHEIWHVALFTKLTCVSTIPCNVTRDKVASNCQRKRCSLKTKSIIAYVGN